MVFSTRSFDRSVVLRDESFLTILIIGRMTYRSLWSLQRRGCRSLSHRCHARGRSLDHPLTSDVLNQCVAGTSEIINDAVCGCVSTIFAVPQISFLFPQFVFSSLYPLRRLTLPHGCQCNSFARDFGTCLHPPKFYSVRQR